MRDHQRRTLKVFLAAVLLAFAGVASAVTYDIDPNLRLLAINNLELDFDNDDNDGFYNITFINDRGNNQYGDTPVFDVVGEEAAIIVPQINTAINLAPGTIVQVSSEGTQDYYIPGVQPALVPFDLYIAAGGAIEFGVWDRCQDGCIAGVTAISPDIFATYARVSPVPVPAAVWLFGSGLLGLVGVARRMKAA